MKDNYSTEQEQAILDTAEKWNKTTEQVRRMLDSMYDSNFWDDIDFANELLYEEQLEKQDKIRD